MALQRARESRPVDKFSAKASSIEYKNLMIRFDIAVADDALEDRSRIQELILWFEQPILGMIESFSTYKDASKAYAEARKELDKIFGASSDSVVPLIRQLTSGAAIPEADHAAHLELYTQLICAEATAIALGQRDLLDRFDNCGEIIEKKLPYLAARWWRDDEKRRSEIG